MRTARSLTVYRSIRGEVCPPPRGRNPTPPDADPPLEAEPPPREQNDTQV